MKLFSSLIVLLMSFGLTNAFAEPLAEALASNTMWVRTNTLEGTYFGTAVFVSVRGKIRIISAGHVCERLTKGSYFGNERGILPLRFVSSKIIKKNDICEISLEGPIEASGIPLANSVKRYELGMAAGYPSTLDEYPIHIYIGYITHTNVSNPVYGTPSLYGSIPLEHGMSGGALINLQGELIGINDYKEPDVSGSGGFVPLSAIKDLLNAQETH